MPPAAAVASLASPHPQSTRPPPVFRARGLTKTYRIGDVDVTLGRIRAGPQPEADETPAA